MKQLWFVMPAYRRHRLTALTLEHLSRFTVPALRELGIDAHAAVITDEAMITEEAERWGFWSVEQENMPLGRKFNDGFELAAAEGADYFVPFGTDNWVMPEMLAILPENGDQVVCRRQMALVHEHGDRLCELVVSYDGGDGIRTFPRELIGRLNFRPALEHAPRAVDTSIIERLKRTGWRPLQNFVYHEVHPLQVIGWQSADIQLNRYRPLHNAFGRNERSDPWTELSKHYDPEMVGRMRAYYAERRGLA